MINDERYECPVCCYGTTSERRFWAHGEEHTRREVSSFVAEKHDREKTMTDAERIDRMKHVLELTLMTIDDTKIRFENHQMSTIALDTLKRFVEQALAD